MARRKSRSTRKGKKFPPEILTDAEVWALVKRCSARAPTGLRNRALIAVLYRGGLRISEALALMPKDLDRDAGTVRILHAKGDRSRTVGLDPGAFAMIERWLDVRGARGIKNGSPIFCTLAGGSMKDAYCRQLFPRLARKAGIDKRVHPHSLRHTMASQLAAEGVPMNVIQQQLGHSSLATTSKYLQHIQPQQVIDTMQARAWTPPDKKEPGSP